MSLIALIIIIIMLFIAFFGALLLMIRKARNEGELLEKFEESKKVIDIKNGFEEISSRPDSSADALLDRMRKRDSDDK